jgi:hypothetical protein
MFGNGKQLSTAEEDSAEAAGTISGEIQVDKIIPARSPANTADAFRVFIPRKRPHHGLYPEGTLGLWAVFRIMLRMNSSLNRQLPTPSPLRKSFEKQTDWMQPLH